MTASVQIKRDYYYIVLAWEDSSGKRRQKWVSTKLTVSGHNKRRAEQIRTETLKEWEDKLIAPPSTSVNTKILFSVFLTDWLEAIRYTISKNTYFSYRQTILNCICPYFAERKIYIQSITTAHIQGFYSYKLEHDKVSPNTIYHYHANIHKALSYAVSQKLISCNPSDDVILPKKQKHIAEFYTVDELKTLLDGCKGTKIETVIRLAAWFGMRRGEIIGLKWDCIDFSRNTLTVKGTMKDKGLSGSKIRNMFYEPIAKTASSIRTFSMPTQASEYLRNLQQEQNARKRTNPNYNHIWDDFVCVQPNGDILPLEYVSRTFPVICKQCGLRKISLHELRHTNISLLLDNGASMKELQEWAGHSSYTTTANIYAHLQSKNKIKLAHSIESILS